MLEQIAGSERGANERPMIYEIFSTYLPAEIKSNYCQPNWQKREANFNLHRGAKNEKFIFFSAHK